MSLRVTGSLRSESSVRDLGSTLPAADLQSKRSVVAPRSSEEERAEHVLVVADNQEVEERGATVICTMTHRTGLLVMDPGTKHGKHLQ